MIKPIRNFYEANQKTAFFNATSGGLKLVQGLGLSSDFSVTQNFAATKNSALLRNFEGFTIEEKPGSPSCCHYTLVKSYVNSELGIIPKPWRWGESDPRNPDGEPGFLP